MSDVLFSVFPNERFVDLSLFQYGYEKCDPFIPTALIYAIIIFSIMSFPEKVS